jgi:uncharacterized protein YprB with RNaseH-like and TPR domain
MNELNNNAKLLISVAILPVIADLLQVVEHLLTPEIRQQHTKNLIYKIRRFDQRIMNNADPSTVENQIDIQRAARQWMKDNFEHVPDISEA